MTEFDFSVFDIESQFLQYIKRGGVPLEVMPPVQVLETRRAFYGSWGVLLLVLRDNMGILPENIAIRVMDEMLNNVNRFWENEVEQERIYKTKQNKKE